MATEGWRGLETGDLGDQLEFGVLLAVFAQLFVELQCLQRNIWQIFYMNSSIYGEVRSRKSTRLIYTGTVFKVKEMFLLKRAHDRKGSI